ncbi:MAG TPA: hypothetical protein PKD26_01055 [Pyrinomonadaceae bacterium]|nr:hypothetical protein [Pyrinomonadaceae bacterium]
MKIALMGYGAMAKLIDQLAVERRHKAPVVFKGTDAQLSAALGTIEGELALKHHPAKG